MAKELRLSDARNKYSTANDEYKLVTKDKHLLNKYSLRTNSIQKSPLSNGARD